MTYADQLLEDVERMEKQGRPQEEIAAFVDEQIRLANIFMMAIL